MRLLQGRRNGEGQRLCNAGAVEICAVIPSVCLLHHNTFTYTSVLNVGINEVCLCGVPKVWLEYLMLQ